MMTASLIPRIVFPCCAATGCMVANMPQLTILRTKYWDPKFKKLRGAKVIRIPLPDYDELRNEEKLSAEEIRAKLKEKGIAPPRKWAEKPIFISCTGTIFEPYIPPEGDGKITLISTPGVKQKYETFEKKGKSYLALRKIRNFEYDFDVPTMAEKSKEIYIDAHTALAKKDEERLHDLVTERCFQEMMEHVKNKTVIWKFIQSLELPRVVHIRCQELLTKNNMFAQATVRFHSQQSLAVYDRFGRLMYGDENKAKDVLEYVVFEKHLSYSNGTWRIQSKIIPDWMPPKDNILKTFCKPDIIEDYPVPENSAKDITVEPKKDSEVPLSPAIA